MFKNFLMSKLIESKLSHLPKEEKDKLVKMITENPDFFKKIAEEVQVLMKQGKNQTTAMMEVMNRHKDELSKLAGK